jgi:ATP-dependent protease HslVU (ClpYQ) peptidase subunit
MTTIVAYQGENYAAVGVDSRISSMDEGGFASQIMTLASGSSKVASNGKYLLGAAGDVRAINILHHAFTPPMPTVGMKGKKLDQFMTIKFIPALRECFEKQGYATSPESESAVHMAQHESTILVVVNANIYVVDGDYSWASDATGIYALGTGSAYALGAMHSMIGKDNKSLTPLQAKRYITKSLNIAAKFDPYTGSPFQTYVQEFDE